MESLYEKKRKELENVSKRYNESCERYRKRVKEKQTNK